jgi:hypothetical protein
MPKCCYSKLVSEWVKENSPKAIIGGVKLGANAAIPMRRFIPSHLTNSAKT